MSVREQWPVACIHHLRFNSDGLIPAIAQDWLDGAVLMLAWMNRVSLLATFETGQVHDWSGSRQELWHKGATSGHLQLLRGFRYDCDADALLLSVEQVGDTVCALTVLDALQDGLSARGIPWHDVLRQARRSPLR